MSRSKGDIQYYQVLINGYPVFRVLIFSAHVSTRFIGYSEIEYPKKLGPHNRYPFIICFNFFVQKLLNIYHDLIKELMVLYYYCNTTIQLLPTSTCGCHRNIHRRDPDDPTPLHHLIPSNLQLLSFFFPRAARLLAHRIMRIFILTQQFQDTTTTIAEMHKIGISISRVS